MYFRTLHPALFSLFLAVRAQGTNDPITHLTTKVLILGGGMTGVSAAHSMALDLNITDLLVVEARHELGGRVQQGSVGGISVEFGANWIQGLGNNPIWELVQKYDVKNLYSNWSNIGYYNADGWEGEDGPLQAAMFRYQDVFPAAAAAAGRRKALGLSDLSMDAGLKMNGWDPLTAEERTAEYVSHDLEMGEPPIESSFIGSIEAFNETFIESGNRDNNLVIDKGGFQQVVLKYGDEIPGWKNKVLLNQIVETIAYDSEGVMVTTKGGYTIHAEYALCTFSLGVLQHDDVKFEPPLPSWKGEAIANFHMATYTKIFAQFPIKFWNDTEFTMYSDPDDRGYYAMWQSLDLPNLFPGSKVIFATLTSEAAYRAELQSDVDVQADFVAVLRDMYGAANVPEPTDFTFPRWTLDPLFRGTFTNWGAGSTVEQQEDMRAPIGGNTDQTKRLFFAGEHTSRRWFGYLHGSYWEGSLVAHEMADCIFRDCVESDSTMLVKRDSLESRRSEGPIVGRHRSRHWG